MMQLQKSNIDQLINQIEHLNYNQKVEIMDRIIHNLKRNENKSKHGLLDLKGLGKDIWKNIDVDSYIQSERQSWD